MIGQNVEADHSNYNLTQTDIIENKSKLLKYNNKQVQNEIRNCFAQLTTLLQLRERQLLHQACTLQAQQLSVSDNSNIQRVVCFNVDNVKDLQEQILHFGKVFVSHESNIEKTIEADHHNADNHSTLKSFIQEEQGKSAFVKQLKVISTRKPYLMDFDRMYANLSNLCKSNFISNIVSKSLLMQRLPVLRGLNNMPIIIPNSVTSPSCSALLKIEAHEGGERDNTESMDLSRDMLLSNLYKVQMKITNTSMSLNERKMLKESFNADDVPHIDVQSKPFNSLSNIYNNTELSKDFATDSQNNISTAMTYGSTVKNHEILRNAEMQPKQIQHWLQRILVETEIEPMVHEIGQFSEISQARFYNEFPVET